MSFSSPPVRSRLDKEFFAHAGGAANGAPHRAQRKGPTGGGGVSTVGLFAATGPALWIHRWEYHLYPLFSVNVGLGAPPGFSNNNTLKSIRPNQAGSATS